jgi:hypothetical protein
VKELMEKSLFRINSLERALEYSHLTPEQRERYEQDLLDLKQGRD